MIQCVCPFGCEYTCERCEEAANATDQIDPDLRLGAAIGLLYLVVWLVSVIGLVLL